MLTRQWPPGDVAAALDRDCPGIHELLSKPGKQPADHKETAGQQEVNMPSLRHAFPGCRLTRDDILLDQRDVVEMIGENASGEQARHAGACNDRMPKLRGRHRLSFSNCLTILPEEPLGPKPVALIVGTRR